MWSPPQCQASVTRKMSRLPMGLHGGESPGEGDQGPLERAYNHTEQRFSAECTAGPPKGMGLSPSGSRVQPGRLCFHQFPRQIPGLLVLGAQRTLTPWKGESGSLGPGCWEQGRAALPGRERLAEGLPRMPPVPIPAVRVRGNAEPSAPLRAATGGRRQSQLPLI